MASALELQDLYNEALVREVMEKTQNCALTWEHLGGNQFQASETIESVAWDFFVSKTQIGNLTYKYTLDVKKATVAYISISDGPLPYTSRDSATKDLYDIVEITVLNMDGKLKEAIQIVQNLSGCGDE